MKQTTIFILLALGCCTAIDFKGTCRGYSKNDQGKLITTGDNAVYTTEHWWAIIKPPTVKDRTAYFSSLYPEVKKKLLSPRL
jgi:hypothetical protein